MQHLEGDLETYEDKMLLATQKLDKVTFANLRINGLKINIFLVYRYDHRKTD